MRTFTIFSLLLLLPSLSQASEIQKPLQGFRVGVRMPIATGEQRALTPDVGFGVEVRLDTASRRLPFGFAFVCGYDEFFLSLPDRELVLSDGSVLVLSQTQTLSYTSFAGEGTARFSVGPFLLHAALGAGLVVGFFHSPPADQQTEIFLTEMMPSLSSGAGLALPFAERGVVDLGVRYQRLFFNDKVVQKDSGDIQVFHDTLSVGVTAGYLF